MADAPFIMLVPRDRLIEELIDIALHRHEDEMEERIEAARFGITALWYALEEDGLHQRSIPLKRLLKERETT